MKKVKVVTVVGTRPEIIRLSRLIPKLDEHTDHILVHTGQNYDPQLSDVFFKDLELRQPDYYLDVDTSSFGSVMGDTLRKSEEIFLKEKPDAVMILGDTNSAVAAIAAERLHIPVYHMEAGNRSFDNNVPEELNRRMVDHVATFNLPYTEHARRNLIAEGLSQRFIHKTGSPMMEILTHALKKLQPDDVLQRFGVQHNGFLLLSLHRQENVDNASKLESTLTSISRASKRLGMRTLVSVHPRLRERLKSLPEAKFEGLEFLGPFGFLEYLALQTNAYCVISDSGSVSEEAAILGFRAINLRNTNERPESITNPNCVVCAPTESSIDRALDFLISTNLETAIPDDYSSHNFSDSVLAILYSTVHSFRFLRGLEPDAERH